LNLGSLLYLPGLSVTPERTAACLANLARWKHKYPIYIYSEREWHPSLWRMIGGIEFSQCENPEVVRSETVHHVPKLAYLMGVQIAANAGLELFLTLETDSRVWGDNWDEAIFDEFLAQQESAQTEMVLGGTMFVWHPFNDGLDYALEFGTFVEKFIARRGSGVENGAIKVPNMFIYGGRGSCSTHHVCAYPNGAGSVARTSFVQRVFGPRAIKLAAQEGSAWDAHLGYGLFESYGPQGYRRLAPLNTVFSVYGDLLTSEGMRIGLLTSGQCRLAHQIKSDWSGAGLELNRRDAGDAEKT